MIAEDIEKFSALDVVATSEGGKILVKGLIEDVVNNLDGMLVNAKTMSIQEFVSVCASMKAQLDLARAIKRSGQHKDELTDLLKEEMLKSD